MHFRTLSHACLEIGSNGKILLTDPWLVGSCYWRSWWNYPPVADEIVDQLLPDAIYITHIHWDHFHGPSLKRFPKDTLIIIPYERSTRISRDLAQMRFTNVVELAHGKSLDVGGGIRVTSYQFSPWGDSAVVIEADGITLLNANDAKFMGGPLRQILNSHGPIDFAFRSHSSANDRVCYEYLDEGLTYKEDPMLYAASFYRFMEKVQPRYAVPFASNHCHLHRDVYQLNKNVATPIQVRDFVDSNGGFGRSKLKIMISGDLWDSEGGFELQDHDFFSARQKHIELELERNRVRLEKTYALEDKVRVSPKEFKRFFDAFLAVVPSFLKRSFRDKSIFFAARYGGNTDYFMLDVFRGEAIALEEGIPPKNAMVYETNALVLKKAMAANMFSHLGISKRVTYRSRREDARHLKKLNELLAAYEYEVLPLRRVLSLRTIKVYFRRWRELILYVQLVAGLISGKNAHELEARYLK